MGVHLVVALESTPCGVMPELRDQWREGDAGGDADATGAGVGKGDSGE